MLGLFCLAVLARPQVGAHRAGGSAGAPGRARDRVGKRAQGAGSPWGTPGWDFRCFLVISAVPKPVGAGGWVRSKRHSCFFPEMGLG